jgi:hypothetical protein
MLKQNGCGASIGSLATSPQPSWFAKSFECSAYWAFFWETGPARFPTQYSQYNLKDSIGTFQLSATLTDARSILRKDNFFALSPPDGEITDTAESVLTVKRCAVITRILIFNGPGNAEPSTAVLFHDLTNLLKQSPRTKISDVPKDFVETGIFDPLP